MKLRYFWLICILSLLEIQAFAGTNNTAQHTISVNGHAKLNIPIDQVKLGVGVTVYGKSPQKIEEKGYQIGIKLKSIFKKYQINESSITASRTTLNSDNNYDDEGKVKTERYYFYLHYSVLINDIKLIDAFRKECIKAGAKQFDTLELLSRGRSDYEAKAKRMAYQNAKEKAQAIISGSGLKLGKPVSIDSRYSSDYATDNNDNEGLGAVSVTPIDRESLLQQKQFFIEEKINVVFSIE